MMARAQVFSRLAGKSFFKGGFFLIDLAFILIYLGLFVASMFLGINRQTQIYNNRLDAQRSTIGQDMYGVSQEIYNNPEMPKKHLAYLRHGLVLASNLSEAIKKQEADLDSRRAAYLQDAINVSKQADILNDSNGPIQASDADIFHENARAARRLIRAHMSFEFNDASLNFPNIIFIFSTYFFNPLSILMFLALQLAFFLLEKERKNERLLQTLADVRSLAYGKMIFAGKRFLMDTCLIYLLAIIIFLLLNRPLLRPGYSSFNYPVTYLDITRPLMALLWPLCLIGLFSALLINLLLPLIYQKLINRPARKGMKL